MQAPTHNSTVYVGNLPFFTTRKSNHLGIIHSLLTSQCVIYIGEHLIGHFQQFGNIQEIRMQAERGFAFVRMETHEGAAMAITKLQGANINGRPARVRINTIV
jgi:nucleolysin TIA-1/TIAR